MRSYVAHSAILALFTVSWVPFCSGFAVVPSLSLKGCGARSTLCKMHALRSSTPRRSMLQMSSGVSAGESPTTEASYVVPEHCRKIRVRKPLGIILEEVHDGKGAFVVQVNEGSNAEKAGIKVGELLVACSAATLKAGREGKYAETGHGGRPFEDWEIVMFPCIDSPFKQIMQALASNNERWGINTISVVLAPKREESGDETEEKEQ